MEGLITFITSIGVFAILFVIFAESGLMVGFFLPGDSLLFTAGFLVKQAELGNSVGLHIGIHLFAFLLFLAAVIGESTGYWFGRKVGRRLFERENTRFFRKENLLRAEEFYEKRGPITIVLACFVPIIRTFVPIVAGVSGMSYKKFLPYNIIGAFLWTYLFVYLGYFAGDALHKAGINVEVAALIIIFLSISPMLLHVVKDPVRRRNFFSGIRREIRILFGRKTRS